MSTLVHPLPMAVTVSRPAAPARADRRLAAQLARRDDEGVRAVHAEHGAVVFGFLRRALADAGEAEDVFQQVMLEVWRRGPDYDPARASVLTWVMTIARSRAIDARRRRRPEPRDPALLPDAAADSELDELLEQWRLAAYVARLKPDDRAVLQMRFQRGLSQTEIAAATGIPLGTIKTRMVRGLEALRAMLEAEGS